MKQIAKRLLTILLVVCYIFSSDWGLFLSSAANDDIFSDDFSKTALSGWISMNVGTVSDGVYNIIGDGKNFMSSPIGDSKYAVQSKMSFKKASGHANSTASIIVGANEAGTEYFEFGLGIAGNTRYAFLYKRSADEEKSRTIYQLTKDIPGTETGRISLNKNYVLCAIMEEGKLSCYINGEKFTEYANVEGCGKYAGVCSTGADVKYEDFRIKKVGEKKIESIQVLNAPEKVSVNGVGLSFDIKVTYTDVYGIEIIPSDTSGVIIKGFDGKIGVKNFTVTYGGKTAVFQAEVIKDKEPKVIFTDDFKDGISQENWTLQELTAQNGYKFNYQIKEQNGKAVIEFPNNIGNYAKVITARAALKDGLLSGVKNYKVEADAVIVKNTTVEGGRAADAGLDVAYVKNEQLYSYRLRADGTVVLYYGTTIVAQTGVSDFKLGQKIHMKAEVYDGVLCCYYNDKCVLTYQNENLKTTKRMAAAAFRGVNGTVYFDNFTVTEIPEKSIWAATAISLDDLETKEENIGTIKAHAIEPNRYLVKLHYSDGSFLPIRFDMSMLSDFSGNSKQDQKVTLVYGALSKQLYFDYTDYIFFESFQSEQSEVWKYASNSHEGYITTSIKNGLQIVYAQDSNSHELSQYVDKFADYPNVKISADVALQHTDNFKVRRAGVRARYQGGSCYEYLLSYDTNEDEMYAVLYRRTSKGLTELAKYSDEELAEVIDAEKIYIGVRYTLTLECIGRQLYVYFNGHLIDVCTDTSEEAILSGSGAGYRAVNTSATIANFRVEEATSRSIKGIVFPELEESLKLYQGMQISPYDYSVRVQFTDGIFFDTALTVDMISEYDNITPGKRDVTITCLDTKFKVPIEVIERPEYIDEFVGLVKKAKKAKKLTLKDEDTIEQIQEMYKSLSGYEISTIKESIVKKYQSLVDAMYRLQHPELDKYDTVYVDDFNGDIIETEWSTNAEGAQGTWTTINSNLINEQERYGWNDKISYLENTAFYGEVNSVEADVMLTNEDESYISLLSCVGDLGYYHVRLAGGVRGEDGEETFIVQLYKYVGGQQKLAEAYPAVKDIDVEVNQWHKLRLTTIDGLLTVYLDDVKLLEHDDSSSSECLTTGSFGFRALYGDLRYDSLRVMGTKLEGKVYEPQIEPTYYKDDFEDEKAGENPSHWIEETDSDEWKVYKKSDSLVYGTSSSNYTYTWLHTFESDPTITMDFMVENAKQSGRIEFLTRYTQEIYSYAGVGYDFSESKWYVYTARGEDFKPQTVYAENTYNLKAGNWYTIRIEEEGIHIKVFVDDELVIEDKNAYMTGYGRIGLLSENTNLYIDNVSYTMPHGGSVNDGVTEFLFDYDTFHAMSHMEIESLGDSTLLGVYSTTRVISKDNGVTWSIPTGEYLDVKGTGLGYPNIMKISEGTYIMIYADTFEVYRSTDYMKTWKKIGQVIPDIEENKDMYGAWETLTHVNSMTKVTLDNGQVRVFLPVGFRRFGDGGAYNGHYTKIFYSDDMGATWSQSQNDTRDITPNYTEDIGTYFSWTEGKVIKCSDGSLRMYNSRQYDCIVYTESFDGGVTWEGMYSVPYLQNGQTSFGVAEDPENPGTYYMACLNTKTRIYNSTLPRNRLSLVKSTDGKNWEFVMDIERFTSYGNYMAAELYQIIDPSVSIIDGYLYITMGRSYAADGEDSPHGRQSVRLVKIAIDKLPETTKWNDANLADSTRPKTIEIERMPQTIFGLGDIFVIGDGKVKLTAFNGNVTYEDMKELTMATEEPNMYKKATYQVAMMNRYAQTVSFEVEVTDNYNIEWNIQGEGEVTPHFIKIAKGLTRTFTAKPVEGWKVKEVLVNGTKIDVEDNQFTITGSEDITVDVIFTEKSTIAIWVLAGSAAVLVGIVGTWVIIHKKEFAEIMKKRLRKSEKR